MEKLIEFYCLFVMISIKNGLFRSHFKMMFKNEIKKRGFPFDSHKNIYSKYVNSYFGSYTR